MRRRQTTLVARDGLPDQSAVPWEIAPFVVRMMGGKETKVRRVDGLWEVKVYRRSHSRDFGSREGYHDGSSTDLSFAHAFAWGRSYPNLQDRAFAIYVLEMRSQ